MTGEPVRRHVTGLEISSPVPLPPGVRLLRGSWIPWIGGVFTGSGHPAAAVTVGSTIIVNRSVEASPALIRHELEHVRQWREEGWRFPFRYAVQYLKHGYRANPYEVAARDAENRMS